MSMKLLETDLLPNEAVIASKKANLIISINESGLSRFAFDQYMGFIGMKGKESIGGKVYLTNHRIIFKSHFFNRVRGKHSILLANILDISSTFNNLIVNTPTKKYELVMWFKTSFMEAINEQISILNKSKIEELKSLILKHPDCIGSGLTKWTSNCSARWY